MYTHTWTLHLAVYTLCKKINMAAHTLISTLLGNHKSPGSGSYASQGQEAVTNEKLPQHTILISQEPTEYCLSVIVSITHHLASVLVR